MKNDHATRDTPPRPSKPKAMRAKFLHLGRFHAGFFPWWIGVSVRHVGNWFWTLDLGFLKFTWDDK